MGFNSVVFITNDNIDQIEKDPAGWWRETWHALVNPDGVGWRGDGTYGFGSSANGFKAVSNEHADVRVVIVAGGNSAHVMDKSYVGVGHGRYDDLTIIKELAAKHGYRLVKKQERRRGIRNHSRPNEDEEGAGPGGGEQAAS